MAVAGHDASEEIAVLEALTAAGGHVEQRRLDIGVRDARLMELLAPHRRPCRAEWRRGARARLEVADREMARIHRDVDWQHTAHRVTNAVEAGQRASEVHQSPALCVQGHALGHALAKLGGERDVGRELCGEALGIATADVDRVGVRRQLRVDRWPERDEREPGVLQEQQVLLVVERERTIARDGQPRDRRRVLCRAPRGRSPSSGDAYEPLDVQALGRVSLRAIALHPRCPVLLDRHETEVALSDLQRRVVGDRADRPARAARRARPS